MKSLSDYSTSELHEELIKREGVREVIVDMGQSIYFYDGKDELEVVGPARIIVNID